MAKGTLAREIFLHLDHTAIWLMIACSFTAIHMLGFDGGQWYAFWSGAGADLGELAIIGAVIGMYRKHRCHVGRCWRLGKSPIDGTPWIVCHHHHPAGHPTEAHIAALKQQRQDADA